MTAERREVTLRFLAEPADVNFGGKVHGGILMKWIDQAGYACASGWSGSYCVTVYVGGIAFEQPVAIGHLVEVRARIVLTGRSSMHIAVDVYSRGLREPEWTRTTHCLIVFVAVDEAGKPHPVPAWIPETETDRLLADYAGDMKAQAGRLEAQREQWLAAVDDGH
ncbi:MAG: acyl-CoA thioesterase [Proteobacteria bacterium]|nr:acyl-CoA thioesterase [Pseudomonadota bacterium]